MKRTVSRLVRAIALVGVCATVAGAHAIHTTMSAVTADATGLTFTVRTFADDFSGAVAKHAGHAAPRDSSVNEAEVLRYVRATLRVTNRAGAASTLESCGVRRARELYWVCIRAPMTGGVQGAVVQNRLLTEWHADQVNIVQFERGGARKTTLFTRHSAPAAIGAA